MRLRVIVPVVLVLAAVGGLVLGARLPSSAPAAAGGGAASNGANPGPSPSASDGGGVTPPNTPTTRDIENYPIKKLKPGEKPPQFVVVSFDGACKHKLMQKYMALAKATNSHFTFFMSGLCLVPDQDRFDYHPPLKPVGSSAIGFADPTLVSGRITDWGQAYLDGNELGTHWLGHFCDTNGVGAWNSANWQTEWDQVKYFLDDWQTVNKSNPSADMSLKLPYDSSDIHGDRTPCLAGKRSAMYPVFAKAGFTYDASGTGELTWPKRIPSYNMWEFPLQTIKILDWPGNRRQLSMDYNLLYTQNDGKTTAPPAKCAAIQKSAYASFTAALQSVYNGNRAPFIVGNHFNTWVCDAYVNALTQFIQTSHATMPGVEFVSFEYLVKWLGAQSPAVIKEFQSRPAQPYGA